VDEKIYEENTYMYVHINYLNNVSSSCLFKNMLRPRDGGRNSIREVKIRPEDENKRQASL
jgi:hypothetical protein